MTSDLERHHLWVRKNAFGRLHYFLLISWTLFSYLCTLSVLFSCGIGPNYVETATKSVKDVSKVSHFDFVMSTLSMTFQCMWALIQALILISARKLDLQIFGGHMSGHTDS